MISKLTGVLKCIIVEFKLTLTFLLLDSPWTLALNYEASVPASIKTLPRNLAEAQINTMYVYGKNSDNN